MQLDIDLFGNTVGMQGGKAARRVTAEEVASDAGTVTTLRPCRHCQAPTLYAVSDRGFPMMVDAHVTGPFVIDGDGPLLRPLLRHVSDALDVLHCGRQVLRHIERGETRYTSHFASCPKADEWQRPDIEIPVK